MKLRFSKIKTPEELLAFMKNNINYGYLGKSKRVYNYIDPDFNNNWYKDYILQDKESLLKTLHGICWDQVELEREWFSNNNYEFKTIFEMVSLDYNNNYPTHTFLVYKDNNKWNWFENSDDINKGIHTFNSFDELINYQYETYINRLKEDNITNEEIKQIIITEYQKPKAGINVPSYLDWVINSSKIDFNK